MSSNEKDKPQSVFLVSSKDYFSEMVLSGFTKRNVKAPVAIQTYLVNMLEHYLDAKNLFGQKETLAEMFLTAGTLPSGERVEMLKRLADKSLYISGFFGDSLNKKIIDVDYYVEMGGAAYASLADSAREDLTAQVYRTFSLRFVEFVDVLTYISQQSLVQSDQDLLRLYDRYMRTGSELAKDKLIEMGVLTLPKDQAKLSRQD